MEKLKAKLKKQGGFTLIEMLIVVAIIAILIAVSIPLVNSALERARIATDAANERAAKAEITILYLTESAGMTPNTQITFTDGSTDSNWLRYDAANGKFVNSGNISDYAKCAKHDTDDTKYIWARITSDGSTVTLIWSTNEPTSTTDNTHITGSATMDP